MQVVRTREEVKRVRAAMSRDGIALVPTMGALHDGHLSHVGVAREVLNASPGGGEVWVSIFVNPTQFGPGEDFDRYPRPLESDLEKCAVAGADVVWVPGVEDVYPPSAERKPLSASLDVPELTDKLEGSLRPGHFAGVCRVVMKLLGVVEPGWMTLGRKDYQQLCVLRALVSDLAIATRVVEVPTMYEPDGLAMSSRNAYLTPAMRETGLSLSRALAEGERELQGGEPIAEIEASMHEVMTSAGVEVDDGGYAVVRHPRTLGELTQADRESLDAAVLLVAGRVRNSDQREQTVRLIDNHLVPLKKPTE